MDRISGLSDELLVKILLLVPTKVAVSTSILSKRWEYMWMWLPKLEYNALYSESEAKRLQSFLDRNLPLHRTPVMESFHLKLCTLFIKPENINMWVLTAVFHCVRELEIQFDSKQNILPSNLFTCNSLVILKLDGGILLDVPRMVSLPFLKTLKLKRVRYFNVETLQRLLSNCPVLEDLALELRKGDTSRKLTLVVPFLQRLSLDIPDTNDTNGFVIETPALKYFKLIDYNPESHYCLKHMPNLIEAYLDVELTDMKSIIKSITSVKRLVICSGVVFEEGFVFNQLEHLEVCRCKDHSSNQLGRLLKCSPILRELNLFSMGDHETQCMDYWNEPSTVPECMLSSLQSLDWLDYTGAPQERDVVVYILEHALHLKTATIMSDDGGDPKFEMLQELALSCRASATCKLMFE